MSWQTLLVKASFDTQKIKGGSIGFKIIMVLDGGNLDSILKKIKSDELNLGGVRSSLNKIIRLFNQINEQSKSMEKPKWEKVKQQYEDITFAATATDVPISSRMMENAAKLKEMLDDFSPAKIEGGKRNPKYKDKISKKVLKLYEEFLSGTYEPLVNFLNEGSQNAKNVKLKQLRLWENNNNKFVKHLKSAKANKARLMGYDTNNITLLLPDDFNIDIIPNSWNQEEEANGVRVTLPPFLSIAQGKKYAGGEPSEKIEQTFFARIFKQPKYSSKKAIVGARHIEASSIDDTVVLTYIREVLTKLKGANRNKFLPHLQMADKEFSSGQQKDAWEMVYGAKTHHQATAKVLPALEYLLKNSKLEYEGGFVRQQSKESLRTSALRSEFLEGTVGADHPDLQDLFDKYVKQSDDENPGQKASGFAKFDLALRAANTNVKAEYKQLLEGMNVIPNSMSKEMQTLLLKPIRRNRWTDSLKNQYPHIFKLLPDKDSIRSMALEGHKYGDASHKNDAVRIKQLKDAIERMVDVPDSDPPKVKVENRADESLLAFLFNEIDYSPLKNMKIEFAERAKKNPKLDSGNFVKYTLTDSNTLSFFYMVSLIARLEVRLLGSRTIASAFHSFYKKKRVIDRKSKSWVETDFTKEELEQREEVLKDAIDAIYPEVRTKYLDATKEKIKDILEDPSKYQEHISEGGWNPRDWIRTQPGLE